MGELLLEMDTQKLHKMRDRLGWSDSGEMINRALNMVKIMIDENDCRCTINGKNYTMENLP